MPALHEAVSGAYALHAPRAARALRKVFWAQGLNACPGDGGISGTGRPADGAGLVMRHLFCRRLQKRAAVITRRIEEKRASLANVQADGPCSGFSDCVAQRIVQNVKIGDKQMGLHEAVEKAWAHHAGAPTLAAICLARSSDIAVVDKLEVRLGFEPVSERRIDQGVDFLGAVLSER